MRIPFSIRKFRLFRLASKQDLENLKKDLTMKVTELAQTLRDQTAVIRAVDTHIKQAKGEVLDKIGTLEQKVKDLETALDNDEVDVSGELGTALEDLKEAVAEAKASAQGIDDIHPENPVPPG